MNCFLYFGMKILDAHAQAIETQLAQRFEVCARSDAGINFDADFTVWCEMKMLAREFEQVLNLLRGKIRRRAAAPVELHDRSIFRNAAADAFRLAFQHVKVRRWDALVFLDHDVAGAKQAQAL